MRQLRKDSFSLTGTSVLLGVGSGVVGRLGGSAAPLARVGKVMPTLGTLSGAGAVMRSLNKLQK